jgi:hypothetical protein
VGRIEFPQLADSGAAASGNRNAEEDIRARRRRGAAHSRSVSVVDACRALWTIDARAGHRKLRSGSCSTISFKVP